MSAICFEVFMSSFRKKDEAAASYFRVRHVRGTNLRSLDWRIFES